MLLTETYKRRLLELAGIISVNEEIIVEASTVEDPYAASKSRVKFDLNLMKQAIEGGLEVGLIFQSDNDKYKMPIWKTRVVWPFVVGYDKKGQLVIRGVHVEGQSEKKALETRPRKGSAQAKDEWRLFKVSNIKSMFFTGGHFQGPPSGINGAYNPHDSAMISVIMSFDSKKAIEYQKNLDNKAVEPTNPVATEPLNPVEKPTVTQPKNTKEKEDAKKIQQKIDKLNKLL